jgi:uncharacterized protein YndB with AHSA1/START domain
VGRVVRRRRIATPAAALWEVISDPYHLPRWWPRTQRVENVTGDDPTEVTWTQVLETKDGRGIRADYHCVDATPERSYVYEQDIDGTPFERFLVSARTEIKLEPEGAETKVSVASIQRLRGLSRLGSPLMRRGIGETLSEALSGLERAATGASGEEDTS